MIKNARGRSGSQLTCLAHGMAAGILAIDDDKIRANYRIIEGDRVLYSDKEIRW